MIPTMQGGARFAPALGSMFCGRHILLAAAIAACASGGACFFTDPINSRPAAEIELLTPGLVHKNDLVTVSARKSTDPNDEFRSLRFSWLVVECPAPNDCNLLTQGGDVEEFGFRLESHLVVNVELTVTDPRGANHNAALTITPANRPPTVRVTIDGRQNAGGGYTLGRELTVFASGEDGFDQDPLSYDFAYFPPTESQPVNVIWEQVNADTYRLVPDVVGMWQAQVI